MDTLMPIEAAAQASGVLVGVPAAAVEAGSVHAELVGGRWMVSSAAVHRWLAAMIGGSRCR